MTTTQRNDRAPHASPAALAGLLLAGGLLATLAGALDHEDEPEGLARQPDPVRVAPAGGLAVEEDEDDEPDAPPADEALEDDELVAAIERQPDELEPVVDAAQEQDVEPELAAALAWHESRWDQSARSHVGAVGVMQVMPSTAERVADRLGEPIDPTDPEDNALAGVAYLADLKDEFDATRDALIAYNMGSGQLREQGPLPQSEAFADRVLATAEDLAEVRWRPDEVEAGEDADA